MKELQWKSIKGKIFKIYLLIHYNFSHEKKSQEQNSFITKIYIGNVDIFSTLRSHHAQFFNVNTQVLLNTIKSSRHHIFIGVLKPD